MNTSAVSSRVRWTGKSSPEAHFARPKLNCWIIHVTRLALIKDQLMPVITPINAQFQNVHSLITKHSLIGQTALFIE